MKAQNLTSHEKEDGEVHRCAQGGKEAVLSFAQSLQPKCTLCTICTLSTICTMHYLHRFHSVHYLHRRTICTLGSMLLADGPKSQFFTTPEVFCDTHCAQCTANSPTEKNLKVHNCCKNKEQEQDWKPGHFSVCKHRVHFGRLPFTKCLLPLIPCLL